MTQFKDKSSLSSERGRGHSGAGLFLYPVLQAADIQLDAAARALASELDGSLPDPQLVLSGPESVMAAHTAVRRDTLQASWQPGFYVPDRSPFALTLFDHDLLGRQSLGGWSMVAGDALPRQLEADAGRQVYWSATLDWRPAHR